jgi:hypothetical protein
MDVQPFQRLPHLSLPYHGHRIILLGQLIAALEVVHDLRAGRKPFDKVVVGICVCRPVIRLRPCNGRRNDNHKGILPWNCFNSGG